MDNDIDLRLWVDNLEAHNNGELRGEWVDFPCDKEEWEAVLKRIGVREGLDEYFFPDFEGELGRACYDEFGEYGSHADRNAWCEKVAQAYDKWGKGAVLAALETGEGIDDILGADTIEFFSGVHDDKELGEAVADEFGTVDGIPDHLRDYFDYEKYGRDVRLEQSGSFTKLGYVALI